MPPEGGDRKFPSYDGIQPLTYLTHTLRNMGSFVFHSLVLVSSSVSGTVTSDLWV